MDSKRIPHNPTFQCVVAVVKLSAMRMQAALLGDKIEFRDGKFYLSGVSNDLASPAFPAKASFDVIFMLELDIEDFGREVSVECVTVDPDGRTVAIPPDSATLPTGAPGEATGWFRIIQFREFQFAEPGTHEILLMLNNEEAGRMALNLRTS